MTWWEWFLLASFAAFEIWDHVQARRARRAAEARHDAVMKELRSDVDRLRSTVRREKR